MEHSAKGQVRSKGRHRQSVNLPEDSVCRGPIHGRKDNRQKTAQESPTRALRRARKSDPSPLQDKARHKNHAKKDDTGPVQRRKALKFGSAPRSQSAQNKTRNPDHDQKPGHVEKQSMDRVVPVEKNLGAGPARGQERSCKPCRAPDKPDQDRKNDEPVNHPPRS